MWLAKGVLRNFPGCSVCVSCKEVINCWRKLKWGVEAKVLYSSDLGSLGLQTAGCVGNQKVICSCWLTQECCKDRLIHKNITQPLVLSVLGAQVLLKESTVQQRGAAEVVIVVLWTSSHILWRLPWLYATLLLLQCGGTKNPSGAPQLLLGSSESGFISPRVISGALLRPGSHWCLSVRSVWLWVGTRGWQGTGYFTISVISLYLTVPSVHPLFPKWKSCHLCNHLWCCFMGPHKGVFFFFPLSPSSKSPDVDVLPSAAASEWS